MASYRAIMVPGPPWRKMQTSVCSPIARASAPVVFAVAKENTMRLLLSIISVFGLVTLFALPTEAKPKKDSQVEAEPPEAATENNACGCYRDKDEKCHCIKVSKAKLKCQCENDCEPPECTAKRQHDEEKAAELALKKAKERDKKAQEEAKKAQAQRDKDRKTEQAKKEKEKEKENSDPRWKLQ
ncbi:MAG TPA: hypothetical protein VF550_01080 [Polyangia bacterium]